MNRTYNVDLTLIPATLDYYHALLAGAAVVSLLLLLVTLFLVMFGVRRKLRAIETVLQHPPVAAKAVVAPEVKIVEKIIEKPAPEPIVLREATPDAALQLLGLLQKDARFIDFIQEDLLSYSDADIGVAARVVHEGCKKVLGEYFVLAPVRNEQESSKVTLPKGFDAEAVRITGNIVGQAPFTGTLVHKGWRVTEVRLPKLTQGHNAKIIAAAEVEL